VIPGSVSLPLTPREVALELVNFMEDVVATYVDEVTTKDKSFCGCPRCRLDVIAIALNDIRPKYVVTTKGYAYARMGELQAQFRADTIVAVTKALKIVKQHPLH
jgi:competence protein ComFB